MEPREIIEQLVTEIAPNATVAAFEDGDTHVRVTLAGTTGVLADCELPRRAVEAVERGGAERSWVATTLKRCADDVVAPIPDGRG
jgi:hypothetical protein